MTEMFLTGLAWVLGILFVLTVLGGIVLSGMWYLTTYLDWNSSFYNDKE